jgi:hypothetical protein
VSTVDLNRALQFGHSKIAATMICLLPFEGFRDGIGHVLTGVATSKPQFGQLTNEYPHATIGERV